MRLRLTTRRKTTQAPLLAVLALVAAQACSASPPAAGGTGAPAPDRVSMLTRTMWRITSPADRAPGSVYGFFPGGALMMTSCVEVYRLAEWTLNPDGTLTIAEDPTVAYDADVLTLSDTALSLRLHLKTEDVTLTFEPARTPFVCPDLKK